jgi:hypothetical protein
VGFEIIEKFPEQFELLRKVFPEDHFTHESKQRLDLIYRTAEADRYPIVVLAFGVGPR